MRLFIYIKLNAFCTPDTYKILLSWQEIFFFAPWNQGRECVPIILGSTIEFNFATMRQEVVLCYPPTSDAAHTSMTTIVPDF